MNLYELSARYEQLLAQDELNEVECAELDALHDNIEDECISRGKYIKNIEAEREAVVSAIKSMISREVELNNKANRQREKLAERMAACNIQKVTKSPLFTVKLKQNPVSVEEFAKDLIPENYWTESQPSPVKRVNKTAIREAIESGVEVPGARLVRTLKIELK